MSDLQIFNYGSNEVRTVMIDGEPWFVLRDVCQVLGISHVKDTADRLDPDEVGQTEVIDSLGRKQTVTIINESGLYAVILRSDKPEAKPFRKWVTAEVLPRIRKEGGYIAGVSSIRGTACEGPAGRPEGAGGPIRPHRRAGGGKRGPDGGERPGH